MFKELEAGCMPVKETEYSTEVTVFSAEDATIRAGETIRVRLGIAIDEDVLKKFILSTYSEYARSNARWNRRSAIDYVEHFMRSHYLELTLIDSLQLKRLIFSKHNISLYCKEEFTIMIGNPTHKRAFVEMEGHKNIGNYHLVENDSFYIHRGDSLGLISLVEHKNWLFDSTQKDRTIKFNNK